MNSAADEKWMRRALELAALGQGHTRPNPCVGAVIVSQDGELVGEGFHKKAGQPHAEVEALADALRRGNTTRGATMYVTLEPCNHTGRTSPCTLAITVAGIARVVVGATDPNNKAAGGIDFLRSKGIEATCGLLATESHILNAPFITYHMQKRPFVTLKWAMSADGCTSLPNGESRWITGEGARAQVHRNRAEHDAVLAGIGTVLRDNSKLTARSESLTYKPMRIVLDPQLRLPATSAFVTQGDGSRAVVVCSESAAADREAHLSAAGVEVWRLAHSEDRGVDLRILMRKLWEEKIQSLYVEGGRAVAGSLLAADLVDQVHCWIAAKILGGGPMHLGPVLQKNPADSMASVSQMHHTKMTQFAEDWLLQGWLTNHLFGSGADA